MDRFERDFGELLLVMEEERLRFGVLRVCGFFALSGCFFGLIALLLVV